MIKCLTVMTGDLQDSNKNITNGKALLTRINDLLSINNIYDKDVINITSQQDSYLIWFREEEK